MGWKYVEFVRFRSRPCHYSKKNLKGFPLCTTKIKDPLFVLVLTTLLFLVSVFFCQLLQRRDYVFVYVDENENKTKTRADAKTCSQIVMLDVVGSKDVP